MIMLNIKLPCAACQTVRQSDSQPNYCRKCGGRGFVRSTISRHQLSRMPEIPEVISAFQTGNPRPHRRSKRPVQS